MFIQKQWTGLNKQLSGLFHSNTSISITLLLGITDVGYFMIYMYNIYKLYAAKTELPIDLKAWKSDRFSYLKSACKWNGEKPFTAEKGHPEEILTSIVLKPRLLTQFRRSLPQKKKELGWEFREDGGVGSMRNLFT